MADGDYPVGRGRPPMHSRFKPGQSGNPKGRRSRLKMKEAEIVAMIRDEPVRMTVKGKAVFVSMFEAVVRKAFHCALTTGSVRDLEKVLHLCGRYGALPEDDRAAESKAAAEAVMQKIADIFDKTEPDDDPDDPGPA